MEKNKMFATASLALLLAFGFAGVLIILHILEII
jgi:hypothetical protein